MIVVGEFGAVILVDKLITVAHIVVILAVALVYRLEMIRLSGEGEGEGGNRSSATGDKLTMKNGCCDSNFEKWQR